MITIRSSQLQAFETIALRRFEDEMVEHSRAFSPPLCQVLGEEGLRLALRRMMERGLGHRLTYRGPLRLFIELSFLFGSNFDTDPQYPWAGAILKTEDEQMDRAEKLHAKVLEYQKKVSGPELTNTRRALEQLLVFAREPAKPAPQNQRAALVQELDWIFPEKVAYIGPAGIHALIDEAHAKAVKAEFAAPRAETLLVSLMFAFGHGCTDDPLYPWIGRTIVDQRIPTPAGRAERLEKKAVTWLEHVLARKPLEMEL